MSEIIEASSQQPSISSLSQHRVPIPNDIQDHLRRQYEHIGDDQGGVDHVTTATTPIDHFTRILNAMKVSPKGTICRVNLLLENSVDVVLEEINQYLSQLFCAEESISTCIADSTTSDNEQTHEGDGSEIVTRNVKFEARKHDIFHDVIEIHPSSSSIVNEATSLSSFTGIPQALCHRTGIFSHRSSSSRQKSNFPSHCKVVLCDRRCGEAVLRGSNIFVRGVLGADRKIERDDIVCVYSHVSADSIPSRGIQIESYQSGRCIFLGLGKAACTRAQMFNQSTGLAVIMFNNIMLTKNNDDGNEKYFTTKAGPLLPSMNGILSKKIMLQNLPSILVAHVLNPQSKDVIVDLCCAPGGKTSHVASLVNNDATIVAIDKSKKKMKTVKQFFQEMGASCITPLALDSTKCVLNVNEKNGQPWMSVKDVLSAATYSSDGLLDVKGFYPESFDKIVLDPPCSALGLVNFFIVIKYAFLKCVSTLSSSSINCFFCSLPPCLHKATKTSC